jgi:Tfp pilus assembly protein PilF
MTGSSHRTSWCSALLFALACAGCAPPAVKDAEPPPPVVPDTPAVVQPSASERKEAPPPPVERILTPAEQELEKGIKNYEDGVYKTATKELQAALGLGLPTRGDRAMAHKYLAFINCVSGRSNGCRDEFRKAFAADPNFDLTPAEAGHPMWGPVFRSVKTAASKAKPK